MKPLSKNIFRFRAVPLVLKTAGMASSSSDAVILGLGVVLAAVYLFRDTLFAASKPKVAPSSSKAAFDGSGNPRDFIAKMKDIIPIGRVGNEEDIAGAVLYLASRAGSFVSGAMLKVRVPNGK